MIDFEKLKTEALASPKKRSRVIREPGFDMVICLHQDSDVGRHRHPKFEAYHLIKGMLFVFFDDEIHILTEEAPMLSIPPGVWHLPMAVNGFAIYREFYCGPFEKERDVEYALEEKAA